MVNKFGESSWGDAPNNNNDDSKLGGKDLFLRLDRGSNVLRLISNPFVFYQHRYKIAGSPDKFKWGYRINCSATKTETCPVCEKGDHAKKRYLVGVIERKTGMFKVLDIGPGIFNGIHKYDKDEDWGTPDQYDIDIVFDPNGGPQNMYSVIAKPKKTFANDIVTKEQSNVVEILTHRTTPPTREKVQEKLDKIMEELGQTNPSVAGLASSMNTSSSSDDEEGEDDFFKKYDSKSTSV